MKHKDSDEFLFRPFQDLKKFLKKSKAKDRAEVRQALAQAEQQKTESTPFSPLPPKQEDEKDPMLFNRVMADVKPLPTDKVRKPKVKKLPKGPPQNLDDQDLEARGSLTSLINHGYGFEVSNTPEYMEGTGYNSHPEMSRRLHKGDFAIQAHLDLHRMNTPEAWQAFDSFLKESLQTARQAVLIIHGRGLSSPGEPVLKYKVGEWLTCGPWRKWVAAFASARPEDGGAGATYVLLRARPTTKSARKGKKIKHY